MSAEERAEYNGGRMNLKPWTLELTPTGQKHGTRIDRFRTMEHAEQEAYRRSPGSIQWTRLLKGELGVASDGQYMILKDPQP
jgi:hypothetical protein